MARPGVLFLNVMLVAACGLVYELLAGTLASYVLGDSVTQFSLVIGVYLSAMGVGAWLSGYLEEEIAKRFVDIEFAVALIGGLSAPALFLCFGRVAAFQPLLFGVVFLVGVLVGLELPLLMRILKDRLGFKDLVSKVLAFDYLGALAASVLFPILFVPKLGLIRTGLAFGLLNAAVGLWATFILAPLIPKGLFGLRLRGIAVVIVLLVAFAFAGKLTKLSEEQQYPDDVVYAASTPYQRIVVTRGRGGFNLYLNGHLQFAASDEYRYHEALVHPAMALAASPKRVLILGGGDGLAVREILKHPGVTAVTLVDLDPGMTGLSTTYPPLAELNGRAFSDPRVTVVNEDAFVWADRPGEPFDAAIIDFPDPSNYSVGKLYTTAFYRKLRRHLTPDAAVCVQCTSPLFARPAFWCVVRTLEAAGFAVKPYHIAVPSFGVWGFALCRVKPFEVPKSLPPGCRFLTPEVLPTLFVFPADAGPTDVEVNRLDNQVLVRYHETEWRRFEH